MSGCIHHGPPGSYKTSGAIQSDVLPELAKGRAIVTNVRGMSASRFESVYPEWSSYPDVIYVDTDTTEGREKMARWWHWAPFGAFLLFDEAQLLFPRAWKESDLRGLDYPGGQDQAKADGRPYNWLEAWTKHRHYNFDFVMTAPNIKLIRSDIREVCESGFRHVNLGLFGMEGLGYLEIHHQADDDGTTKIGELSRIRRKINKKVFATYDSTATGKFARTRSGKAIWKHPRLLFPVGVLVLLVLWRLYESATDPFDQRGDGDNPAPVLESVPVDRFEAGKGPLVPVRQSSDSGAIPGIAVGAGAGPSSLPDRIEPPVSGRWRISGVVVDLGKGDAVLLLTDGSSVRRESYYRAMCRGPKRDPRCEVDGELVTYWSGQPPSQAEVGTGAGWAQGNYDTVIPGVQL
jgi:zona occludens toxin